MKDALKDFLEELSKVFTDFKEAYEKIGRRTKIIIVIILALLMCGYYINKAVKNQNNKWNVIDRSFMADFNNDNKEELLLISSEYEGAAPMKLVNIENGENIWISETKPSLNMYCSQIVLVDTVLAIAYDYGNDSLGVEGFNSKTGKKIWEYHEKPRRYFHSRLLLFKHQNNIFLCSTDSEDSKSYITSISPKDGRKRWEAANPDDFLKSPLFFGNKMVFNSFNYLQLIEIETGNMSFIKGTYFYSTFTLHDSLFYMKKDILYKHDTVPMPVMVDNERIKPDLNNKSYQQIAFCKERLISLVRKINGNESIQSSSFISKNKDYEFYFPDSIHIESTFYDDVMSRKPELCAFYNIRTRYIPLILQNKIDSSFVNNKLAIFDVDSGKLVWESNFFKAGAVDLISKDIVYYKGHYLIALNFNEYKNHHQEMKHLTMLCLNGKTGKFISSVAFHPYEQLYFDFEFSSGFEMFAGDYLYGPVNHQVWCLKYPELDLLYTTDKELKVKDAKESVEKLLGKTEWEN